MPQLMRFCVLLGRIASEDRSTMVHFSEAMLLIRAGSIDAGKVLKLWRFGEGRLSVTTCSEAHAPLRGDILRRRSID